MHRSKRLEDVAPVEQLDSTMQRTNFCGGKFLERVSLGTEFRSYDLNFSFGSQSRGSVDEALVLFGYTSSVLWSIVLSRSQILTARDFNYCINQI
ncbi:MAG: hypothetical protein AAGH40_03680 [Verrucomicrobiota bacterium]